MRAERLTRRQFLAASAAGGAALAGGPAAPSVVTGSAGVPAILGGPPLRSRPFPRWPRWDEDDEKAVVPVLRGGVWSRDKLVTKAERRFAELMGSPHCLATCNGTNAIITALRALGVGAGDEVVTTPYTFVATIHPILLAGALPVFVDVDPDTWQIDPARIEARITPSTTVLLPVHILGGVCDMERIGAIAQKRSLKSWRMPARPTSPSGRDARRGPSETSAASASRPARRSRAARAAPSWVATPT